MKHSFTTKDGISNRSSMVDTHAALRHHQMNENVFYTSLAPLPPVNPINMAGEGRSFNYGAFKPVW